MIGRVPVPVGESGTPVSTPVVLDGDGKGGVLSKAKELVSFDQKIEEVGLTIDTKILVNVSVMRLPDMVMSLVFSVVANGGAVVAVPFRLLAAPLVLDSIGVCKEAVGIVELEDP